MLGVGIPSFPVSARRLGFNPSILWPTGTEPGMWIDPSNLTSQWQDYTGTTPVATPGTVADTSNPVGLALDLRLGAPTTLGPELVVNGDFAVDLSGVTAVGDYVITRDTTIFPAGAIKVVAPSGGIAGGAVINVAGLTAGKPYILTASIYSPSSNATQHPGVISWPNNDLGVKATVEDTVEDGQYVFYPNSSSISLVLYVMTPTASWGAPGDCFYATNISVREIPGNHLLQATSTARPLLSARVNLLTYTEDFNNTAWANPTWGSGTSAYTRNYALAPDGTQTATRFVATAPTTSPASGGSTGSYIINGPYTRSVWIKSNTGINQTISLHIDLLTRSLRTVTPDWQRFQMYFEDNSYSLDLGVYRSGISADTDAACDILIWHPQVELGDMMTDYQSVPGNGSSYPSTGFPIYQHFDGTDDGMATASFAAGTLINGMDCLIAVRRDSDTPAYGVVGMQNQPQVVCFGMYTQGSSDPCCFGCGTPTVLVNNVQLPAGTKGELYTALTVGDWHVLEFRGLDLSAWTKATFGEWGGGVIFNGAQGGILLFPSSTSTADRDAARTWLGAKVGLTL